MVAFRGIVGFGVGGCTVPFDLLAEFLPNSHRGQFLMYIEYFWTIGCMFVVGFAWYFLFSFLFVSILIFLIILLIIIGYFYQLMVGDI